MKSSTCFKAISVVLMFTCIFTLACTSRTSAQALDQVSLLMKFKGNWEGAYGGKDSILYWQTKPIAKEKALYSYAKVVYKGKIVLESWAIYAFDQEINKVIWFELLSDQTLLTYRGEFTSATTLDLNISSKTAPETVLVTLRLQFRTPDVLDVTETNQSSGAKNAYVFKRTKQ